LSPTAAPIVLTMWPMDGKADPPVPGEMPMSRKRGPGEPPAEIDAAREGRG